jgi:hypothetical protein
LTSIDTAARWWRAQTVAEGLNDLTLREFSGWASDRSRVIGQRISANNNLLVAALWSSPGFPDT